jgi:hypothetical protein
MHGDSAQRLRAGRLHVVDAVGACDDAFQRRGDETSHEVGVGADVHCCHANHCDITAGILPHAQGANRLQAGDEDHQVDDERQHRALDEQVGELH